MQSRTKSITNVIASSWFQLRWNEKDMQTRVSSGIVELVHKPHVWN